MAGKRSRKSAAPGGRDAAPFQLQEFLPYSITVLAGQMSEQFAAQYQPRFNISVAEWRVLAHVAHDDQLSVREISTAVVLDKAKTSRAIARLEAAGHVRKRAGKTDGRLIRVSLTPKGRRLYDQIVPLANAFQASLLDGFDPAGRRELADALARLHARLDRLSGS